MSFSRHFLIFIISKLTVLMIVTPVQSMNEFDTSDEDLFDFMGYELPQRPAGSEFLMLPSSDSSSSEGHHYPRLQRPQPIFQHRPAETDELKNHHQPVHTDEQSHHLSKEDMTSDEGNDMSHHFFDRMRRRTQRICGEMIFKTLHTRCRGCFKPLDASIVKLARKRDGSVQKRGPTITEMCCQQGGCSDEVLQEFCCTR